MVVVVVRTGRMDIRRRTSPARLPTFGKLNPIFPLKQGHNAVRDISEALRRGDVNDSSEVWEMQSWTDLQEEVEEVEYPIWFFFPLQKREVQGGQSVS